MIRLWLPLIGGLLIATGCSGGSNSTATDTTGMPGGPGNGNGNGSALGDLFNVPGPSSLGASLQNETAANSTEVAGSGTEQPASGTDGALNSTEPALTSTEVPVGGSIGTACASLCESVLTSPCFVQDSAGVTVDQCVSECGQSLGDSGVAAQCLDLYATAVGCFFDALAANGCDFEGSDADFANALLQNCPLQGQGYETCFSQTTTTDFNQNDVNDVPDQPQPGTTDPNTGACQSLCMSAAQTGCAALGTGDQCMTTCLADPTAAANTLTTCATASTQ